MVRSQKQTRPPAKLLDMLLAYESGIFTNCHDWYVRNWNVPVMTFPRVSSPGRLLRGGDGKHILAQGTVEEYFAALGVAKYFRRNDPDCLVEMQYRSTNGWGYIGYQLGEALLFERGYYRPQIVREFIDTEFRELPLFYCGEVAEETWRDGLVQQPFYEASSDRWILATDVNRWDGSFTGKGNIWRLEELFTPELQDGMMVDIMCQNLAQLKQLLKDLTGSAIYPNCATVARHSLSSLAASCHLVGVRGTARVLTANTEAKDQLGTSASQYMARFANLALPDDVVYAWDGG